MAHGAKPARAPAAGGPTPLAAAEPSLIVPPRFRGPAGSGNGGYVSGRVAAYLDGPATVTLHLPPPLDTAMAVEHDDDGAIRVSYLGAVVVAASPARDRPMPGLPDPVSMADARAAEGGARYYDRPLFPDCFVCGPRRRPGDGLRIFPGPVPGRDVWAAPWTPDASLADGGRGIRPEIVWAALDCPSGIAASEAADIGEDAAILLGRMTAAVAAVPAVGQECRVMAWPVERDGRKLRAASALLGPDGRVLATARAVWVVVPRPVPGLTEEAAP